MGTFYDENSPTGPVPGDSEPGVIGMRAALTEKPMPAGHGWLPGYYNPGAGKVAFAEALASAMPVAYFSNPPHTKFADESQLSTITFQPVPGMEKNVGSMGGAGYNPFSTKEPKTRQDDHTPTNVLVDRLANSSAMGLGSSDAAMLQLLMDA